MNTLYLDVFSGISGDMFLGALFDLGVDAAAWQAELDKLGVGGWHFHAERRVKAGIAGMWAHVHLDHDQSGHGHSHAHSHGSHFAHHHGHPHHHAHGHGHAHVEAGSRNFAQIRELICGSTLSEVVKSRAIGVFQRVADAEGKIHGLPSDQVHFHEVGAVDSIVDIVGACVALEMLGSPRVLASAVTEGCGTVKCAHGVLPVPAPATLEILRARSIPFSQCEEPHELVTPTGAALLAEFVEAFGPAKDFAVQRIGYGLGTRENRSRPNVLRASLGSSESAVEPAHDWETDAVTVIEANLDDISGEVLGDFVDKALKAGALDVFHTPIQMKKSRPATLLTVLCATADAERFTELVLRHTTSFGVRRTTAERRKLRRQFTQVATPFGEATVKLGLLDGEVLQVAPEYESCRALAEKAGVPVRMVFDEAAKAAR